MNPKSSLTDIVLRNRSRLIGVVDLKRGQAVHAVAGERHAYRPVATMMSPQGDSIPIDGDPIAMIRGYQAWGLSSIYCADLDAIAERRRQTRLIESVITASNPSGRPSDRLLLDVGLDWDDVQSDWLGELASSRPTITWIIASESTASPNLVGEFRTAAPDLQLGVSLDYKDRRWINTDSDETLWIEACRRWDVGTVIALDLAAVGTRGVARAETLSRGLRQTLSGAFLITGGGVHTESDIRRLQNAGADSILVASLLIGAV